MPSTYVPTSYDPDYVESMEPLINVVPKKPKRKLPTPYTPYRSEPFAAGPDYRYVDSMEPLITIAPQVQERKLPTPYTPYRSEPFAAGPDYRYADSMEPLIDTNYQEFDDGINLVDIYRNKMMATNRLANQIKSFTADTINNRIPPVDLRQQNYQRILDRNRQQLGLTDPVEMPLPLRTMPTLQERMGRGTFAPAISAYMPEREQLPARIPWRERIAGGQWNAAGQQVLPARGKRLTLPSGTTVNQDIFGHLSAKGNRSIIDRNREGFLRRWIKARTGKDVPDDVSLDELYAIQKQIKDTDPVMTRKQMRLAQRLMAAGRLKQLQRFAQTGQSPQMPEPTIVQQEPRTTIDPQTGLEVTEPVAPLRYPAPPTVADYIYNKAVQERMAAKRAIIDNLLSGTQQESNKENGSQLNQNDSTLDQLSYMYFGQ